MAHQDESLDEQREELLHDSPAFTEKALAGENCDSLSGNKSSFGHNANNPIPVNGIRGEFKYLNRLRCSDGIGLMWHRLGSLEVQGIANPVVDLYEVVCLEGNHWELLFFHPYHPRRSTWLPFGFSFADFHPVFSKLPIGYGTNRIDQDFPFGLGKFIVEQLGSGLGESMAKRYEDFVRDRSKFIRPKSHKQRIMNLANGRTE